MIDLRSDTLTRPTPAMRQAMACAEVGDDVYGEDPSVNALEARLADLLGKPAALFLPTGTMANLVAILTHVKRGDELIVGDRAHIWLNEGGAPASLAGVTMWPVATQPTGALAPAAIASAIRRDDVHFPRSGLICLENTHNFAGGQVLGPAYMADVRAVADAHGLPVHLDGARLFNAAVALSVPVASLTAGADSAMVALSKGLGCPAGSVLAGPAPFITEARRWRKRLGGGMRQAGVLAAAGLYALDHHVARLADDHENARHLAKGLAALPGVTLAQPAVPTNIVFVSLPDAPAAVARLREAGLLAVATGPAQARFVTHMDVSRADIDSALTILARTLN